MRGIEGNKNVNSKKKSWILEETYLLACDWICELMHKNESLQVMLTCPSSAWMKTNANKDREQWAESEKRLNETASLRCKCAVSHDAPFASVPAALSLNTGLLNTSNAWKEALTGYINVIILIVCLWYVAALGDSLARITRYCSLHHVTMLEGTHLQLMRCMLMRMWR